MGYDSTYWITTEPPIPDFESDSDDSPIRFGWCAPYIAFEDGVCQTDEGPWSEFEEDMTALSLHYPDSLFTVEAIGEDGAESWHWYKAGKSYDWEPTKCGPPPFDPSKLK